MKTKKLNLENLQVQSFITNLSDEKIKTVAGGGITQFCGLGSAVSAPMNCSANLQCLKSEIQGCYGGTGSGMLETNTGVGGQTGYVC